MLNDKEITIMSKGTKITSRAILYKAKQKEGQKAVNSRCRSSVAKFRNLRILQVANFRNPANFSLNFPSLQHFVLHFSSGSIMHLRIRLRFVVFESD